MPFFVLRTDKMWALKCAVEELKWNQFCSKSEQTTKIKPSKPHTFKKYNVRMLWMYVFITFKSVEVEWLLLENLSYLVYGKLYTTKWAFGLSTHSQHATGATTFILSSLI